MLFAFFTTLLFSTSAVCANQSIRHFGSTKANFFRLLVATACLASFAHVFGRGLEGPAVWWFFVSGCIGFGLGDLALYYALPRLGSRLTVLMTQCLAAPVAATIEWLWLGTRLSWAQGACGALILGGVAVALAPGRLDSVRRGVLVAGLIGGVLSSVGQGTGAAISRKAYNVSAAAGVSIDGVTAAYQRIIGGLLVTGFTLLTLRTRTPALNPASPLLPALEPPRPGANDEKPKETAPSARTQRGWPWILANALAGPVLGVSCFQWALATTPSGLVLPIVALTPIVVMPLAFFVEGDRPQPRAIVGGIVAVAGAVALTVVR